MTTPAGLHYTHDHEWLKVDGSNATVGITDYAQAALGDLVFVELPKVGQKLTKGSSFAVVESVKAASEVYAPASGEVVAINEALSASPESINASPYDQGWIAKIALSTPDELKEAMDAAAYTAHLKAIA
jgi:glycine cleavage system H protein